MRAPASGAVAEAYGHKAERIAAPAARSVNTAQVRSGHFGSCLYSGSCSGIGSPNGVLRWLGTDTTEADIRMELACACFRGLARCECFSISRTRGRVAGKRWQSPNLGPVTIFKESRRCNPEVMAYRLYSLFIAGGTLLAPAPNPNSLGI